MAEINSLTNLTAPVGTESVPVQEAGGTLKRILVSWFAKASWFDTNGRANAANATAENERISTTGADNILNIILSKKVNGEIIELVIDGTGTNSAFGNTWTKYTCWFFADGYIKVEAKSLFFGTTAYRAYVAGVWDSAWTRIHADTGNPLIPVLATTASAANAYVAASGDTIYKSTSSKRYKTNILPLSDSAIIDSMKPITYTSDPDTVPTDDPDILHYGFIAEDLAEIDPKLVQYTEDAEGNLIPDGVQYDRITVLLVKRIHELEARLKKAGI